MCFTLTSIAWAMVRGRGLLMATSFGGRRNWDCALQTLFHGLSFLGECCARPDELVVQVCACVRE